MALFCKLYTSFLSKLLLLSLEYVSNFSSITHICSSYTVTIPCFNISDAEVKFIAISLKSTTKLKFYTLSTNADFMPIEGTKSFSEDVRVACRGIYFRKKSVYLLEDSFDLILKVSAVIVFCAFFVSVSFSLLKRRKTHRYALKLEKL